VRARAEVAHVTNVYAASRRREILTTWARGDDHLESFHLGTEPRDLLERGRFRVVDLNSMWI
jgi:hypothetical protein